MAVLCGFFVVLFPHLQHVFMFVLLCNYFYLFTVMFNTQTWGKQVILGCCDKVSWSSMLIHPAKHLPKWMQIWRIYTQIHWFTTVHALTWPDPHFFDMILSHSPVYRDFWTLIRSPGLLFCMCVMSVCVWCLYTCDVCTRVMSVRVWCLYACDVCMRVMSVCMWCSLLLVHWCLSSDYAVSMVRF